MVLTDWQEAQEGYKKSIILQQQQQPTGLRWIKPSVGCYKSNIDASFSTSLNKVGINTCIIDVHGSSVLVKTKWIAHLHNMEVSEAQGRCLLFNE
ncbi:cytochrome p450 [Trifolium pratense]|uniref:Cytochrome p450 n=1 Tax=Trifolium pratense TaxID=57577 RepID=A0A2K3P986_TRIPR|nr:cytochrome p450 [Trifolium pratense]